jgi:hypothetical protein
MGFQDVDANEEILLLSPLSPAMNARERQDLKRLQQNLSILRWLRVWGCSFLKSFM